MFKKNTLSYTDFETMKDLQWHCTKCELVSSQAKTFQIWKQKGLQLDIDEKGNFYKRIHCNKCNKKTVHRKLKTLELSKNTVIRSSINKKLGNKIKKVLLSIEVIDNKKLNDKELEIDHKIPQIRWETDEEKYTDLTEVEIKEKFQLLTRKNNLLKSRKCEKCKKTNKRGLHSEIEFFYKGDIDYKGSCEGCFYFDPIVWKKKLNDKLKG